MVDILRTLYNACDPYRPASREHYLDVSEARGSHALTPQFLGHLSRVSDGTYRCFLFSGHIGCGKSSELRHLYRELKQEQGSGQCYFPVFIDVGSYLDDYDVEVTDILLAMVTELASALRSEAGIELQETYITKRLREFQDLLTSDVEPAEFTLPGLQAKIKLLRKDPGARAKVRAALMPHVSSFTEEINAVLNEARAKLRTRPGAPCHDIVLIVDSLERIRRIEGKEEGLPSLRELFLDRYTQLAGLEAHVIYTVPLRLARSVDGPQLAQRYGKLFVLPMVKAERRGRMHPPYEAGVQALRTLVQRRLGDISLEQAIDDDALAFAIRYSGGHVRSLMGFLQNAAVFSSTAPIGLEAVRRAVVDTVSTYSTTIPESHWAKLAALELSPDQRVPNDDEDHLAMLENVSVLEYLNGEDNANAFDAGEPWYAVNPVVRELRRFKAAVHEAEASGA
jgi:hypothetical protein